MALQIEATKETQVLIRYLAPLHHQVVAVAVLIPMLMEPMVVLVEGLVLAGQGELVPQTKAMLVVQVVAVHQITAAEVEAVHLP
jgi:hypothetical protein